MNLHTIGIIISREYRNRVQKKSFLVTTFVVPVLMAALCLVPILLMMTSKEKTKKVAVVDNSGIVMPYLVDTDMVDYEDYTGTMELDDIKANLSNFGLDAVLTVSEINPETRNVTTDLVSTKPLGMGLTESINNRVEDAIEDYRIGLYEIDGLKDIMKDVKASVRMKEYTVDEKSGVEKISNAGFNSIISMVFGLLLFLFVTLFGGVVMSAVIEEKASRVVEVLVSSVKATELMFGKIIGVALVAFTQFILWIVLTAAIVSVGSAVIGADSLKDMISDPTQAVESMGVKVDGVDIEAVMEDASEGMIPEILSSIQSLPIAKILICFFIFFIFGYMLYASLYAAIGSAVENEGDTQQLQMPVTIPLMIAYFIAIYTFNAPDSALAFWGSIIPFTSPIVMMARLPFGVANWELALSIGLLVVTFAICAWLSAKIYKVGILMFGKKSSFKDLWNWLKLK